MRTAVTCHANSEWRRLHLGHQNSSIGRVHLTRSSKTALLQVAMAALSVIVLLGALASCTARSTGRPPADSSAKTSSPSTDGAAGCKPNSPSQGSEIRGTTDRPAGSAYLFVDGARPTHIEASKKSVKLILRMTGAGPLSVSVVDPSGTAQVLDWGPEPHTSSNFDRPGDEWGLGVTFDKPGCWQLSFSRNENANFWISIG